MGREATASVSHTHPQLLMPSDIERLYPQYPSKIIYTIFVYVFIAVLSQYIYSIAKNFPLQIVLLQVARSIVPVRCNGCIHCTVCIS